MISIILHCSIKFIINSNKYDSILFVATIGREGEEGEGEEREGEGREGEGEEREGEGEEREGEGEGEEVISPLLDIESEDEVFE